MPKVDSLIYSNQSLTPRLMRNSTTHTLPSLPQNLPVRQRKNSSRKANPKPKNPSPLPRPLTRRRLTTLSSPQSRRRKTFQNISRLAGVCPRASSLTNWFSEYSMMLGGVGCWLLMGYGMLCTVHEKTFSSCNIHTWFCDWKC